MDTHAVIRELAGRQQGVVARKQLLQAGVPAHAVDNRVRNGRLEALHRGVYRVGPLRGPYERQMAAVLACGDGALLSHRSAAALWGLVPEADRDTPVDVTVRGRHLNPGPGIRTYRVVGVPADEAVAIHGIPATTPARTLFDLPRSIPSTELERAMARAERKGLADTGDVRALVERYPRRAGTRVLRSVLSRDGGPALTRSEAEARFLELVRRAGLPTPRSNVRLEGFEVDFLWRTARLVVEIDGYTFHSSPRMFDRDRKRDRVLTTAGFVVMRVTLRDLTEEPEVVLVQVAQALVRERRR
jgi:very-short-patch-repair endonuclease